MRTIQPTTEYLQHRLLVARVLQNNPHKTFRVEDVHSFIKNASYGSIYRQLNNLKRAGFVKKEKAYDNFAVYTFWTVTEKGCNSKYEIDLYKYDKS